MLAKNTYEAIEFANEDGMVVGRIWKNAGKFMYAEVIDDCITSSTTIANVQEFLDEVKTFIDAEVSK